MLERTVAIRNTTEKKVQRACLKVTEEGRVAITVRQITPLHFAFSVDVNRNALPAGTPLDHFVVGVIESLVCQLTFKKEEKV